MRFRVGGACFRCLDFFRYLVNSASQQEFICQDFTDQRQHGAKCYIILTHAQMHAQGMLTLHRQLQFKQGFRFGAITSEDASTDTKTRVKCRDACRYSPLKIPDQVIRTVFAFRMRLPPKQKHEHQNTSSRHASCQ